jgi:hypothetical protein
MRRRSEQLKLGQKIDLKSRREIDQAAGIAQLAARRNHEQAYSPLEKEMGDTESEIFSLEKDETSEAGEPATGGSDDLLVEDEIEGTENDQDGSSDTEEVDWTGFSGSYPDSYQEWAARKSAPKPKLLGQLPSKKPSSTPDPAETIIRNFGDYPVPAPVPINAVQDHRYNLGPRSPGSIITADPSTQDQDLTDVLEEEVTSDVANVVAHGMVEGVPGRAVPTEAISNEELEEGIRAYNEEAEKIKRQEKNRQRRRKKKERRKQKRHEPRHAQP